MCVLVCGAFTAAVSDSAIQRDCIAAAAAAAGSGGIAAAAVWMAGRGGPLHPRAAAHSTSVLLLMANIRCDAVMRAAGGRRARGAPAPIQFLS